MEFLADESCDFAVARALRASGHDMRAVAELWPGAEGSRVMCEACQQNRVLLTEDQGFGSSCSQPITRPEASSSSAYLQLRERRWRQGSSTWRPGTTTSSWVTS